MHGAVEQRAVVGDDEHSAVVAGQKAFQPLQGFDIQVVGRLVEQQEPGAGLQQAGQAEAGLLPAAEDGHRRGLAHGIEPQPGQDSVYVLGQSVATSGLEAGQRIAVFLHQRG